MSKVDGYFINGSLISGNVRFSGTVFHNSIFQNYFLPLQLYFGVSAVQDHNFLIIDKNDLPGLVLSRENTAESIIAALIKVISKNVLPSEDLVYTRFYDIYFQAGRQQIIYQIVFLKKLTTLQNEIQPFSDILLPSDY